MLLNSTLDIFSKNKLSELDRVSAIDIQRIVDSKDGWSEGDFTKNSLIF